MFEWQAFDFLISINFHPVGQTLFNIPPLGQIRAQTHELPLLLTIELREIDLDNLAHMMNLPQDFQQTLIAELQHEFLIFILKLSAVTALISIITTALLLSTNKKHLAACGLITLFFIFINLFGLVFCYRTQAFEEPAYVGSLEHAPWMINLISDSLTQIEQLSLKIQTMSENLFLVFEKIEELNPLEQSINGDLNILHISDIHNNVIALDLIENVTKNFQIDLIIDTGDIVDYGTAIEGEIISRIDELNLPYIFIPGNHDSPEIINTINDLNNIKILEDKIKYNDLNIVGTPDPLSQKGEFYAPTETEIIEQTKEINKIINELGIRPHILAVHNHQVAHSLGEQAPLILYGHTHQLNIEQNENTIFINAGTTGASGIRSLETTTGTPPYTMVLLRLNQDEQQYILKALDLFTINEIDQGFTIKRKLVNHPLD